MSGLLKGRALCYASGSPRRGSGLLHNPESSAGLQHCLVLCLPFPWFSLLTFHFVLRDVASLVPLGQQLSTALVNFSLLDSFRHHSHLTLLPTPIFHFRPVICLLTLSYRQGFTCSRRARSFLIGRWRRLSFSQALYLLAAIPLLRPNNNHSNSHRLFKLPRTISHTVNLPTTKRHKRAISP